MSSSSSRSTQSHPEPHTQVDPATTDDPDGSVTQQAPPTNTGGSTQLTLSNPPTNTGSDQDSSAVINPPKTSDTGGGVTQIPASPSPPTGGESQSPTAPPTGTQSPGGPSNSNTSPGAGSSTVIFTNIVTTTNIALFSATDPASSNSMNLPALAASPDTTITSSVFTTINGVPTTIITTIPTRLNVAPEGLSSTQKTGIVVGGAIGGCLVIILLLGAAILYRRRRQNRIMLQHHRLPTPRSNRLEDEDAFDMPAGPALYAQPPRLLRARNTDSGSIFHEGVWPPPGQMLEDPIRAASNVDLSSIVDSVMGRDSLDRRDLGYHYSDREQGTGSRASVYSYHAVHNKDTTVSTNGPEVSIYNTASPLEVSTRSVTLGSSDASRGGPSSPNDHNKSASLDSRNGLPPGAAPAAPQSNLPLLIDYDRPGPD